MRRFFSVLIGFCIIAAGFFGGFGADAVRRAGDNPRALAYGLSAVPAQVASVLRPASARADQGEGATLVPERTYFEVMQRIRSDHYGSAAPDTTKLTYAAVRGMLKTLGDPYTTFWPPQEFLKNMEDTRGDFGGIGAQLGVDDKKRVYIAKPMENSPAMRVGIARGDVILAVDGKPTQGLIVDSVVSRIRGKKGTQVRLKLQRMENGQERIFDVTVVRDQITSPTVEARIIDAEAGIGYLGLRQFNEPAEGQFIGKLRQMEKQNLKALVFDLRGNPGGLLNVAIDIASHFVPSGSVVLVQEKNGRRTSLDVDQSKRAQSPKLARGDYPVVVLIDGGSASASEIVAGAIKDHEKGTLIGQTTFGKGLVQTIFPIIGDAAVKITTQRYFTPAGTDINKKLDPANGKTISGGVKPDVEVEVTDKDFEALRKAQKADPDDMSKDPQFNKAMAILKDQLSGKLPRPVAVARGEAKAASTK